MIFSYGMEMSFLSNNTQALLYVHDSFVNYSKKLQILHT